MYPLTLQPDDVETHIVGGKQVTIPVVHCSFKKWQGEPIANTFGGKGLIDFHGEPMFAELAIQRLATEAGWEARWVETYAMKGGFPYLFTQWNDGKLNEQIQTPLADATPLEQLARIAKCNQQSYYGCWDVLMWNGQRTVFIEAKRIGHDSFRMTQDRWFEAALAADLPTDMFMIAWWDFAA